jgi:hypothetical protein
MFLKTFRVSFAITAIALVLAFLYGGPVILTIVVVLVVLEISLSFDNAVVNAGVLGRMSENWQRLFLTVGILIAVFGMRLVFPVLVVCLTAGLTPVEAFDLALAGGSVDTPGTYAHSLHHAHPAIAAFGGVFLLMLFLTYILRERPITWLSFVERPLARAGRFTELPVVITCGTLLVVAATLAPPGTSTTVLVAGSLGLIVHIVVAAIGGLVQPEHESGEGPVLPAVGRAAFFMFLYLEVIDATFSFDGVIGAFAITSDPVVIGLGLGVGAVYIRSLTVYLVRRGTLTRYVYLEHGAHWAIGALAVLLLLTIRHDVPEAITGLVGVGFIAAALLSSMTRKQQPEPVLSGSQETKGVTS